MRISLALALAILASDVAMADDKRGSIISARNEAVAVEMDIVAAHVERKSNTLTFRMSVSGDVGKLLPQAGGNLGGAKVMSYVWPTSLDPATVGFEEKTGILAFAATIHPDFDDTPLFDENGDQQAANDGGEWHSHWVVLTPNDECGKGKLSVRDIPPGASPKLPATWPGLPLFIDSPGYSPLMNSDSISITVAFGSEAELSGVKYDGVTAALRVHAEVHAPLLCVADVFDVVSGDLSLPGRTD